MARILPSMRIPLGAFGPRRELCSQALLSVLVTSLQYGGSMVARSTIIALDLGWICYCKCCIPHYEHTL